MAASSRWLWCRVQLSVVALEQVDDDTTHRGAPVVVLTDPDRWR
jgi:hypothetical protein